MSQQVYIAYKSRPQPRRTQWLIMNITNNNISNAYNTFMYVSQYNYNIENITFNMNNKTRFKVISLPNSVGIRLKS